jgi:DNA-binding NarL/FixJ family response regulator
MSKQIRLVVVDDHGLFRAGLMELLRSVDDFEVEAEGASGDDAIALAGELKPDVMILDVGMPGPDPTFTIRTIRETSPQTEVVVVTMFEDPRLMHELIKAGAAAYLLKTSNRGELAVAIRAATRSDDMVLVSVSRQAFVGLTRATPNVRDSLSARESSVLRLVSQAKNNKDIGKTLNISDSTVKRHLTNIYSKLGATSRVDALQIARQGGLLND